MGWELLAEYQILSSVVTRTHVGGGTAAKGLEMSQAAEKVRNIKVIVAEQNLEEPTRRPN